MHLSSGGIIRSRVIAAAAALTLLTTGAPAVAQAAQVVTPAVGAHPHAVYAGQSNAAQFGCQTRPLGSLRCYSPAQIQAAYGFDKLFAAGDTGKGRTIVIVDAFGNPYIKDDLSIFDQTFGLKDPVFKVVAPQGAPTFDFNDDNMVGWSGEISLDVEWAHAAAPDAAIVLVVAKSNEDADILAATKYAVDRNLGDVISQSFGEADSCVDPKLMAQEHMLFAKAIAKGITLVASSGDDGAAQPTCDGSSYILSASSPASDPLVLGVGGTNLQADTNTGAYGYEVAWADGYSTCGPDDTYGCSGGGFSTVYSRPFYQVGTSGIPARSRGVPDVAYNAGVDGGVLTHWGVALYAYYGLDPTTPAFFIFGGTSAGSPQWSGLVALADQAAHRRLGWINPTLYAYSHSKYLYGLAFHDITKGTNNYRGCVEYDANGNCTQWDTAFVAGFNARRGWDAVTGLGSPKADTLVPRIAH